MPLTPATIGSPSGVNASAGHRVETTPRAPQFTKHEKARLVHILCAPEDAAGVLTSRGVMKRQQQDARTSRGSVWVVVVAPMFNGPSTLYVPAECADGGIDRNAHPHERTGETLKSSWSDVSFSFRLFLYTAGISYG